MPRGEWPSVLNIPGVRNKCFVFLRAAFKSEKIIISTVIGPRESTACGGAGMVNRAAPRVRIEELADLSKVLVRLPPHHPLVAMGRFEILLFSLRRREAEMSSNARGIFVLDLDHGVRAAIARTLQTIIFRFLRHFFRPELRVILSPVTGRHLSTAHGVAQEVAQTSGG
jgi:hypothetical protein